MMTTTSEARVALPAGRMLGLVVGLTLGLAAGWWAGGAYGSWSAETVRSGLAGTILTGSIALLGVLVMTPWAARPISSWITLWLGGTVLRMLVTPVAAYLLYSATSLPADPLGWSVAATYLATLFGEAIVVSLHVKRAL